MERIIKDILHEKANTKRQKPAKQEIYEGPIESPELMVEKFKALYESQKTKPNSSQIYIHQNKQKPKRQPSKGTSNAINTIKKRKKKGKRD